jgi:hypothetical protein
VGRRDLKQLWAMSLWWVLQTSTSLTSFSLPGALGLEWHGQPPRFPKCQHLSLLVLMMPLDLHGFTRVPLDPWFLLKILLFYNGQAKSFPNLPSLLLFASKFCLSVTFPPTAQCKWLKVAWMLCCLDIARYSNLLLLNSTFHKVLQHAHDPASSLPVYKQKRKAK